MSAAPNQRAYHEPASWNPTERPAWHAEAACRELDPAMFFNETDHARASLYPAVARHACETCSVKAECLEWALLHERIGLWAGTTEADRRRLRRAAGIRLAPLHEDEAVVVEQEDGEW